MARVELRVKKALERGVAEKITKRSEVLRPVLPHRARAGRA